MDPAREKELKRRRMWLVFAPLWGIAAFLASQLVRFDAARPFVVLFFVLSVPLYAFVLIRKARERRRIREGRDGERWPLGEPYFIAVEIGSSRTRQPAELHVGENEFTLLHQSGATESVRFDEVDRVLVKRATIDVLVGDWPFRFAPTSYADRQRLLWELAVRCPDAMERGMHDEVPPLPSAPPAAASPSDDDSARRPSGLALGSALAGPMDRGNPAPPRKSGLGVGLFAPPPESRTDGD